MKIFNLILSNARESFVFFHKICAWFCSMDLIYSQGPERKIFHTGVFLSWAVVMALPVSFLVLWPFMGDLMYDFSHELAKMMNHDEIVREDAKFASRVYGGLYFEKYYSYFVFLDFLILFLPFVLIVCDLFVPFYIKMDVKFNIYRRLFNIPISILAFHHIFEDGKRIFWDAKLTIIMNNVPNEISIMLICVQCCIYFPVFYGGCVIYSIDAKNLLKFLKK